MRIYLRLVSVDHHGFNGRDYPPDDSQVGQNFLVLSARTWYTAPNGPTVEVVDSDDQRLYNDAVVYLNGDPAALQEGEDVHMVFECLSKDGKLVELVDHEVEVVVVGEPEGVVFTATHNKKCQWSNCSCGHLAQEHDTATTCNVPGGCRRQCRGYDGAETYHEGPPEWKNVPGWVAEGRVRS